MKNLTFLILFLSCCFLANGQNYLKEANDCFDKGDYECAKKKFDECEEQLKPKEEIKIEENELPVVNQSLETKITDIKETKRKTEHTNSFIPTTSSKDDYKKNVFGLDLGIGARKVNEWGTFIDFGIRYTYNFSPNIGWDIVNLKYQYFAKGDFDDGLIQVMTGLRCYTNNLSNNIKGFASLKAGFGYQPYLGDSGFGYELEIGLNLTKTISVGFVYNGQNLQGKNINCDYAGLRIGFNF